MENVGVFLWLFRVFLRPFGMCYCHLVILWIFGIFFPVWYIETRKLWQPCANQEVSAPTLQFLK
jgi:hypothetical protein